MQQQAMADGQDLEGASRTVERGLRGDPPDGEERSTHTGERAQQAAQGGDPVDLFSGRLALMAVDLEVPSPFFELALVRRYLSGAPFWGPFGFNWDHNWAAAPSGPTTPTTRIRGPAPTCCASSCALAACCRCRAASSSGRRTSRPTSSRAS